MDDDTLNSFHCFFFYVSYSPITIFTNIYTNLDSATSIKVYSIIYCKEYYDVQYLFTKINDLFKLLI